MKYLQYHEELLFRGHLSSHAVAHAYHTVHANDEAHIVYVFRKLHASAIFHFMAVRELEPLTLHMDICIDKQVTDEHLDIYDAFCRSSVFPSNRNKVKTIVIDGCQNLKLQCEQAPKKVPADLASQSSQWDTGTPPQWLDDGVRSQDRTHS